MPGSRPNALFRFANSEGWPNAPAGKISVTRSSPSRARRSGSRRQSREKPCQGRTASAQSAGMKASPLLLLVLLGLAASAWAGEIYGTIKEGGRPVQKVKVEI